MFAFIKRITRGTESIITDEFYKKIKRNNAKTFESLYMNNSKYHALKVIMKKLTIKM